MKTMKLALAFVAIFTFAGCGGPPSASDHAHRGELSAEVIAEGPRLVAGEALSVEAPLLDDEARQAVDDHHLGRQRSGPVALAIDGEPLGVGVDAELDGGVVFGRIGFCMGIHRLSGWRVASTPDNPMPSISHFGRS